MKTNMNYGQYIPTHILFGAGQLNNLHAQPMPGKRALIVISNGKSTRAKAISHVPKNNCTRQAWKPKCLTAYRRTRL